MTHIEAIIEWVILTLLEDLGIKLVLLKSAQRTETFQTSLQSLQALPQLFHSKTIMNRPDSQGEPLPRQRVRVSCQFSQYDAWIAFLTPWI